MRTGCGFQIYDNLIDCQCPLRVFTFKIDREILLFSSVHAVQNEYVKYLLNHTINRPNDSKREFILRFIWSICGMYILTSTRFLVCILENYAKILLIWFVCGFQYFFFFLHFYDSCIREWCLFIIFYFRCWFATSFGMQTNVHTLRTIRKRKVERKKTRELRSERENVNFNINLFHRFKIYIYSLATLAQNTHFKR